ncbi:hypothetical protein SKAU_G00023200 [Synaphobranchus kaupii]|uniref:Uncharacterized protein n=1 Tax=Synaphobranchus kaupii TaxID=118154 RepID=A0A9Q1GE34_SYNKA|nr:hypothetical protein SKAU_G00023200 [Synaphobranchus kaupii]
MKREVSKRSSVLPGTRGRGGGNIAVTCREEGQRCGVACLPLAHRSAGGKQGPWGTVPQSRWASTALAAVPQTRLADTTPGQHGSEEPR